MEAFSLLQEWVTDNCPDVNMYRMVWAYLHDLRKGAEENKRVKLLCTLNVYQNVWSNDYLHNKHLAYLCFQLCSWANTHEMEKRDITWTGNKLSGAHRFQMKYTSRSLEKNIWKSISFNVILSTSAVSILFSLSSDLPTSQKIHKFDTFYCCYFFFSLW